jgi:ribose transport system permease protein
MMMRNYTSPLSKYGLVIGLAALVVVFSIARPTSFASTANAGSILGDSALLALIAIGIMVPLIVGQFDLSPGFVASLGAMLTAGLLSRHGLPVIVVLVVVLLVGAIIGLVMGILVGYLGLNSLIVSLGVGSVVSGAVLWYSDGQIISNGIPVTMINLGQSRLLGFIPLPFVYVLVLAAVVWYVLAYRPIGRRLYAVGGSTEAARLIGVPVARYIAASFVVSSTCASLAGFLQVARLGAGHPTSAQALLLPAFAAAFLGATAFRPGLYNVWGTFFAVYLLGTGTTGLFMLGAQAWVQPVFNGAVLVLAVTVAHLSASRKRRKQAVAAAQNKSTDPPNSDHQIDQLATR